MLAPRVSESLLIKSIERIDAASVACSTLGQGQLAECLAQHPSSNLQVDCYVWDRYRARQLKAAWADHKELQVVCQSDLSPTDYDAVFLPTSRQGDAEFTRELLQQMVTRLRPGGWLTASVDQPRDTWLREQLARFNRSIRCIDHAEGVVYQLQRTATTPKQRDFSSEFVVRDRERLLRLRTRPGVFSHRRIDTGARCLLEAMEVNSGDKILDIGSGCGVVGVAACLRAADCQLWALDSHPRAVEATRWACEHNDVSRYEVHLEDDGKVDEPGTFDLVLANPPYYSSQRIATLMVTRGLEALRPGGRMLVVTKKPDWYGEFFDTQGMVATVAPVRRYFVIEVRKP